MKLFFILNATNSTEQAIQMRNIVGKTLHIFRRTPLLKMHLCTIMHNFFKMMRFKLFLFYIKTNLVILKTTRRLIFYRFDPDPFHVLLNQNREIIHNIQHSFSFNLSDVFGRTFGKDVLDNGSW